MAENPGLVSNGGEIRRETDSPLEGDGIELPVREHRAMAPIRGFAATSHHKARSAGSPPPMARPRSEAQRGSVRPAAAMRSTHREMRCSVAVQAARYRAARRAAMRSTHREMRRSAPVQAARHRLAVRLRR